MKFTYLVTGGTGSFGQQCVRDLLCHRNTRRVVVFSRCESKQEVMRESDPIFKSDKVRYYLGDIRDEQRLVEAMHGISNVIHAAALKQVPAGQRNPREFIRTNIEGSVNVCSAAWRSRSVDRVLLLSSDKAVDPRNLYGACKKVMEDFATAASARYTPILFACTRWGNVWGSNGSVMEKWSKNPDQVDVHGMDMTRFVLTLQQASRFALESLSRMTGGEIFCPKLPAVTLKTIFDYYFPADKPFNLLPPRGGEKIHETLVAENELYRTKDCGSYYTIYPPLDLELPTYCEAAGHVGFKSVEGDAVTSESAEKLDVDGLRGLVG